MLSSLSRLLLLALGFLLPGTTRAEPLPRRESNVSIRNEVEIAIEKALAHLQETQRADGSWGKLGTTGFVLMAFQRDPRRLDNALVRKTKYEATLEKGYTAVRLAFPHKGDLQKIADFGWNVPPALLALKLSWHEEDLAVVERGRQAIGLAPLPDAPETRALFLALDPKNRPPGVASSPPTGSALAAWTWSVAQHFANGPGGRSKGTTAHELSSFLREHYTLARNPQGEGVHRYYFWLSNAIGLWPIKMMSLEQKLADGRTVDIPRDLAEKLINDQNGNGSWSGVGEHWTEKDADLVTAMCVLTLEQVYRQL